MPYQLQLSHYVLCCIVIMYLGTLAHWTATSLHNYSIPLASGKVAHSNGRGHARFFWSSFSSESWAEFQGSWLSICQEWFWGSLFEHIPNTNLSELPQTACFGIFDWKHRIQVLLFNIQISFSNQHKIEVYVFFLFFQGESALQQKLYFLPWRGEIGVDQRFHHSEARTTLPTAEALRKAFWNCRTQISQRRISMSLEAGWTVSDTPKPYWK